MAEAHKVRSGTTAEHATFAGTANEVTFDNTKNVFVGHDGATAGGFPMLREDMDNVLPAASVSWNDKKITDLLDPTDLQDAATRGFVLEAISTGIAWKQPVQLATTANITLSGEQVIDGVLTSTSRVLAKDQSSAEDNGFYLSGSGAWARTVDADQDSAINEVFSGMAAFVTEGTTNGDTGWLLTTDDPIDVGVTELTFVQFSSQVLAPFVDTTSLVKDPSDTTKQMRIDVGAVGTGTVRTITMPNEDIDLTPGNTYQITSDPLNELTSAGSVTDDNYMLVGTAAGALAWEIGPTLRTSIGAQTVSANLTNVAAISLAKGTIIVATASDFVGVPVGTDGFVLNADSSEASGVKWSSAGAGGDTLPVVDTKSIVKDPADNTKQMRIDVEAVANSTVRTITMPNQNIDLTPGSGSFATEAEGNLAATALQPTLAGNVDGNDKELSKIALKDVGHVVNALGDLGGGTDDLNFVDGNSITCLVSTAAQTLTFSGWAPSGVQMIITIVIENGESQGPITWPSMTWITNGGNQPILQTSGKDIVTLMSVDGGTTVYGWSTGVSSVTITQTHAKVGASAGWLTDVADNLGLLAILPLGETSTPTLIVPLNGLKVGQTLTAFSLIGQIGSAGETVIIDAELRKLTAAAGDVVDSSVATMTQISETANYKIDDTKSGLTEEIVVGTTYYILITGTTGASASDIALQGVSSTVTEG